MVIIVIRVASVAILFVQTILGAAAALASTPAITFDDTAAVATVTPGATTVWVSSLSTPYDWVMLNDDDADGVVRWPWPAGWSSPSGIWSVIDLSTATWAVKRNGSGTVNVQALPDEPFTRDPAGAWSRIGFRTTHLNTSYRLVWIRPGVGAWRLLVSRGLNEETRDNPFLLASVASMQGFDSTPHPAGFAEDDILVAVPVNIPTTVYAAKITTELDVSGPGVVQWALPLATGREPGLPVTLRVIRTRDAGEESSARWRTIDGTARLGVNFALEGGTLVFAPGEVVKILTIPLLDNVLFAGYWIDFDVVLEEPEGAEIGGEPKAAVTVVDDDIPHVDYAGPWAPLPEGDGPHTVPLYFELNRQWVTTIPARVPWRASESGAQFASGELIFAVGERRKALGIPVSGDQERGGDRKIHVYLDSSSTAVVNPNDRHVIVNLEEDDRRRVTAADLVVREDEGVLKVSVTATAENYPVTILYALDGGTARESDYIGHSGALRFEPGEVEKFIEYPLIDDDRMERAETIRIALASQDDVILERASITATIFDDEEPILTISDTTAVEGPSGIALAVFEVRLSPAAEETVKVRFKTEEGTAISEIDFHEVDSLLEFAAGETLKTIAVPVIGDRLVEENDQFSVRLLEPKNAALADDLATATIIDDDAPTRRRGVRH